MKKIYVSIFVLLIGVSQLFGQDEFNTGTMEVVVNAYGRIRLYTPDDELRHLQRASVLVGVSESEVFDYQNDADVVEASSLVTPPDWGDFQIHGVTDNGYSGNPPAVLVTLDAFGWLNKSFAIFKYSIKNTEADAMQAYVGLDIIPELQEAYGDDTVSYLADSKVIHFHRGTDMQMGVKLLSGTMTSFQAFEYFGDYSTDSYYWEWMTSNELMASYASQTDDGLVAITAQEAQTIEPGESIQVYYAIALGNTKQELLNSIQEAQAEYDLISGLIALFGDSSNLQLGENAPNPFVDQTTISYFLPENGKVSLKVYNQIGREISVLVNEVKTRGIHSIDFSSNHLAPGLYYYTLNFNGEQITKKMIIGE